jgi:hypothetical protein
VLEADVSEAQELPVQRQADNGPVIRPELLTDEVDERGRVAEEHESSENSDDLQALLAEFSQRDDEDPADESDAEAELQPESEQPTRTDSIQATEDVKATDDEAELAPVTAAQMAEPADPPETAGQLGPAADARPPALPSSDEEPLLVQGGLGENSEFWDGLVDEEEDEDLAPPTLVARDRDAVDEPELSQIFSPQRPEPTPISAEAIKLLEEAEAQRHMDANSAVSPEVRGEHGASAPLATDDESGETASPSEWQPRVYVAARQAAFSGPQQLSLISDRLHSDVDELNDALAAFAELQPGQKAFIRTSIRAYPEFKALSKEWVAARKAGEDPDSEKKKGIGSHLFGWAKYMTSLFWFHANKSSKFGPSEVPATPGAKSSRQPLSMFMHSEEEKASWKDAVAKARDSHHFEVALRIGVVTKHDDAPEAERIADAIASGFDAYTTDFQEIVWGEINPLEACTGYMGPKRGDVLMSLSAAEMGELARVPDDLTRPHGVLIRHSTFKQLMPANRLSVADPLHPQRGSIPLCVVNPGSEDAEVIGLRNDELDRHMFFCGRTGTGKALDVSTPIPTPTGWRQMGDLVEGDLVFDEHGQPTEVLQAFDVQHDRPTYEVVFSDGSSIVADAEHKWLTSTYAARADSRRSPSVVSTTEIRDSLHTGAGDVNHSIDLVSRPLAYPERKLPVDPYLLGLCLGDSVGVLHALGYRSRTTRMEVTDAVAISVLGLDEQLHALDLLQNRRIPAAYLQSSVQQRWALLQGLLDAAGEVDRAGGCEYTSSREVLVEQVMELAASLGLQPRISSSEAMLDGRDCGPTWTVGFVSSEPAFRLTRKLSQQNLARSARNQRRDIVDVRSVKTRPVRCIAVASPTHLYLAGRQCVPTHNSEMMKWLIFGVAKSGYPMVVIDPHGSLGNDVLNTLIVNCPERIEDLVFCDLGDHTWPVALNPLDIHDVGQIQPSVKSVQEMLEKELNLESSTAPRATGYAVQALSALTEANLHLKDPGTKTTLLDMVDFFHDDEFRHLIMAYCEHNMAAKKMFDPGEGIFETVSEKERTGHTMPVIRAFQRLQQDASFSAVFSSAENRLDFAKLIGEGKIVIVKLARFAHQQELGRFIGGLIIPYLLSSMDDWGRKRDEITGRESGRGCRIFIDEAPTLIGPRSSAISLLAEARKWDLGMVFASQYLQQFDPGVIKAALANTASKVTLALDPDNTAQISKAIAGTSGLVGPNDIADLPDYHMYANVLLPTADGGKATSGVFSGACLQPINCELTTEHARLREQVIERSHALLCNPLEEIRAGQMQRVSNIKTALLQMIQERVADGDPLAGHDPAQQVEGLDLSGDPSSAWQQRTW